jgi:hypothetical protein
MSRPLIMVLITYNINHLMASNYILCISKEHLFIICGKYYFKLLYQFYNLIKFMPFILIYSRIKEMF